MRVAVEEVHEVTDELVDAARRLLPQLSGSATPLGRPLGGLDSCVAILYFTVRLIN